MTKKKLLLACVVAAICVDQGAHGQAPQPLSNSRAAGVGPVLPWLELRDGVPAYTGDDGGGSDTLTVCPSAAFYKRWLTDVTATIPECMEKARGIPITIASNYVEALDSINLPGDYIVFIRAADSTWDGWTGSIVGIKPQIPLHTQVVFVPDVIGGGMMFFPNLTSPNNFVVFKTETILEILDQNPSRHGPDAYGEVISGSIGVGNKGWFHSLGLNIVGDGPLFFRPKK